MLGHPPNLRDIPNPLFSLLQKPIKDKKKIADLITQGLTHRGQEKVLKGDLRCRPPKLYRERMLDKPLPQFRLCTVIDAAHAEDLVMLWAYLTGRGEYNGGHLPIHLSVPATNTLSPSIAPFLLQTQSWPTRSSASRPTPTPKTLGW